MSPLKYSIVILVLACICSSASAVVVFSDDFESFSVGTVLHEVEGWEGWYGDAASAASVSSRYAFSGTKSVEVTASTDAVQVLDITEGKWVLTAMQYIPSGSSGTTRFHMQNTYRNGDIGRSIQWFFSLADGVIGDDYDTEASATIIYDEWVELKLIIDLDNDFVEQYYDDELISARAWVFSGTAQIQSIDLYGNGASTVYYDDFKIEDYLSSLVTAHGPNPEDGAVDVPRDVVLDWVPVRLAEASFPDVPCDHWALRHVEYVRTLGIATGYADGLYRPEATVDRAQMAGRARRTVLGERPAREALERLADSDAHLARGAVGER